MGRPATLRTADAPFVANPRLLGLSAPSLVVFKAEVYASPMNGNQRTSRGAGRPTSVKASALRQ
jgi:hypothetical protein